MFRASVVVIRIFVSSRSFALRDGSPGPTGTWIECKAWTNSNSGSDAGCSRNVDPARCESAGACSGSHTAKFGERSTDFVALRRGGSKGATLPSLHGPEGTGFDDGSGRRAGPRIRARPGNV